MMGDGDGDGYGRAKEPSEEANNPVGAAGTGVNSVLTVASPPRNRSTGNSLLEGAVAARSVAG